MYVDMCRSEISTQKRRADMKQRSYILIQQPVSNTQPKPYCYIYCEVLDMQVSFEDGASKTGCSPDHGAVGLTVGTNMQPCRVACEHGIMSV